MARAAGVDAALVHHYFDGKSDLFIAAMALPFDPRQVKRDADAAAPAYGLAEPAIVEGFLTMWDKAEGTGSSFASCVGGHGGLAQRGRRHARVPQRAGLGAQSRRSTGTSEAIAAAPAAPWCPPS